jgi:hypothetical protein
MGTPIIIIASDTEMLEQRIKDHLEESEIELEPDTQIGIVKAGPLWYANMEALL